jgi:hypothetical protein
VALGWPWAVLLPKRAASYARRYRDNGAGRGAGEPLELRARYECDFADPASVDTAADATFSAFGKVHILCNNAGVTARSGIDHIALDNWRWVLDVNLIGVVNGASVLCPGFVRTNIRQSARNRAERYGPTTPAGAADPLGSRFAEPLRAGMHPADVGNASTRRYSQ